MGFILSLVETNIDEAKNIRMEDDFMQESIKEQASFCLDEDLRESYDHELAWKEEWRRQGRLEGHDEGFAEGRNDGLIEAAKKMTSRGMSIEEISQILDIDIKKLKENL